MLLSQLFILGLASATVSTTVGSSRLFKPLRLRVAERSEFFGDLLGCPYCLGHYSAAILTALMANGNILGLVTTWLAVTAVSALVSGAVGRLYGD